MAALNSRSVSKQIIESGRLLSVEDSIHPDEEARH
jgi:hypothetical protein